LLAGGEKPNHHRRQTSSNERCPQSLAEMASDLNEHLRRHGALWLTLPCRCLSHSSGDGAKVTAHFIMDGLDVINIECCHVPKKDNAVIFGHAPGTSWEAGLLARCIDQSLSALACSAGLVTLKCN